MYLEKSIAVVVPCYNEELLVAKVVTTLPDFVDRVYVVNDCSTDRTAEVVSAIEVSGLEIELISHKQNSGVGASIATGYMRARDDRMDVAVVMGGDAQMDPSDLESIVAPVAKGEVDYAKGNRLFTGEAWKVIPKVRYFGNAALSLLTKVASGYWHVADSQSGYTAINLKALDTIDWTEMYPRYGQPNDLLVRLNIHELKVRDVPIRPVYNVGEVSGLKPFRMMPSIFKLVVKLFFYRMLHKYFIRDFHPLIFFYAMSLLLLPAGFVLSLYLFFFRVFVGPVADTSVMSAVFLNITGLQFLLFAMFFDMERNKHLR